MRNPYNVHWIRENKKAIRVKSKKEVEKAEEELTIS